MNGGGREGKGGAHAFRLLKKWPNADGRARVLMTSDDSALSLTRFRLDVNAEQRTEERRRRRPNA